MHQLLLLYQHEFRHRIYPVRKLSANKARVQVKVNNVKYYLAFCILFAFVLIETGHSNYIKNIAISLRKFSWVHKLAQDVSCCNPKHWNNRLYVTHHSTFDFRVWRWLRLWVQITLFAAQRCFRVAEFHCDLVLRSHHVKKHTRQIMFHEVATSDILVLKLISVLVFILFSSQNFYFISF